MRNYKMDKIKEELLTFQQEMKKSSDTVWKLFRENEPKQKSIWKLDAYLEMLHELINLRVQAGGKLNRILLKLEKERREK
jgi:hypothetical protein